MKSLLRAALIWALAVVVTTTPPNNQAVARVLHGGIAIAASQSLSLSANTVADNAAQGTVIGTIQNVPSGYSIILENDCNGSFQLSGNQLQVGATALWSGWYTPVISVVQLGVYGTRQAITPTVIVNPVLAPSDIAGLVVAWRFDDSSVHTSGSDITSVDPAWGTSTTATGAFGTGGTSIKPQLEVGTGPGGKNLAVFSTAGRSRLTFTATPAEAAGTTYVVLANGVVNATQATFGGATQKISLTASAASDWFTQMSAISSTGSTVTSNISASYLLDHRGVNIQTLTWNGAVQQPFVNGGGGATTAQTGTFTFDRFGGVANGGDPLGARVLAVLEYNTAHDAATMQLVLRSLNQFYGRDFFFDAVAGNDANTGWNISSPKQIPLNFSTVYKSQPGNRWMLQANQTFLGSAASANVPLTWLINNSFAGFRGSIEAYDPATGLPPDTGVYTTPAEGAGISFANRAVLDDSYQPAMTVVGDGTFTFTPTYAVEAMWIKAANGRLTSIVNQPPTNNNSWQQPGGAGTLTTVRLTGGQTPTNTTVIVGAGVNVVNGNDYTTLNNVIVYGGGGTGAIQERAKGVSAMNFTIVGSGADMFNLGADNVIFSTDHNGQTYDGGPGVEMTTGNIPSTNYDSHTIHSGLWKSYGFLGENNWWHGIANLALVHSEYYDLTFRDVGLPAFYLAGSGSNDGSFLLERSSLTQRAGNAVTNGIYLNTSGGENPITFNNTTVIKRGAQGTASTFIGSGVVMPTFNNYTFTNYATQHN